MTVQRIHLSLVGSIPIPVGRKVEVVVFIRNTAIFGTQMEPDWKEPLLIDAESGISYGRDWHYGLAIANDDPLGETTAPVHLRAVGRVVSAKVISSGQRDQYTERTTLVIDLEAPPMSLSV